MSKTVVDERVVSMQFDNKQFESNVKTSMSTIDKLKQKLNFKGAAQGMEALGTSTRKMVKDSQSEFESYKSGIFSIGDAWRKMWSSLEWDAAQKLKKTFNDLFITPVSSGFSEYELKMQSIQTIMMSTGESIDTVNKYLNELNEYSDRTIYSFQDMTSNIGKFTNAGVKLEDAVKAIQGISNEAAVSGANANEASRAMYNFSQALSAGYVKLIDWKSIENANMATVEFKNELIKTAVELGTVTEASDGMYQTLSGNAFNATKNFNEVFQDQWMTSEVLVQTLGRYADETTDIGKKAFAAAQEIKTFSQMMDTLKETAQSGWARTWEIMFGSLPEAKKLWTGLGEAISGVLTAIDDARNDFLEAVMASPFGKIAEKLNSVAGATEKVTEVTKKYGEIVDKIIRGDFGNGQERIDKLTKAGYDWAKAQNLVNEVLGSSVRHIEAESEAQSAADVVKANTVAQLSEMSDAQLKVLGLNKEEIDSLKELRKIAEQTGYSVSEIIKNPDLVSGRNLIIKGFANIGNAIKDVWGVAKKAYEDIFPPKTIEERAAGIYKCITAFHKFTSGLTMNEETIDKVSRTFKGLFAVFDILTTLIMGPAKIAFKLFSSILAAFDLDILSFTAMLGDGIVKVRDWIDAHNPLVKLFESIAGAIKLGIESFGKWIKSLKGSKNLPKDIITGLVNGITAGVKMVVAKMKELGLKILESVKKVLGIHSPSKEFFEIGQNIIQGLVNGIKGGFGVLKNAFDYVVAWLKSRFENFNWGSVISIALSGGLLITLGKLIKILNIVTTPLETVFGLLEQIPNVVENIFDFTEKFNKVLGSLSFNLKAGAILKLAGAVAILAGSIIALGIAFNYLEAWDMWQGLLMVTGLVAVLGGLMLLMTKLSKPGININTVSLTLSGLSVALLGMAACIAILASITWEQLWHAGVIAGGFLFLVMILIAVINVTDAGFTELDKKGKKVSKTALRVGRLFIAIGLSLLLMAAALKIISSMYQTGEGANNDALFWAAKIVGGFMILAIAMVGLSAFAKHDFKGVAELFGNIGWALLSMSLAILILSKIDYAEMWRGVNATIAILGALTVMVFIMSKMIHVANFPKVSAMFMSLGVALLTMSVAIAILSALDPNKLLNVVAYIGLFMVIMGFMASFLSGKSAMVGFGKFVMSLGVAMLGLALAIGIISMISWEGLGKAVLGLTALLTFLSVMLLVVGSVGTDSMHKASLVFLGVGAAVLALATSMLILSLLSPNAIAKGIVAIAAMGAVLALIVGISKLATGSNRTIIALAIAIGVLAASIAILSLFKFDRIMGAVLALSTVIVAFSLLVGISKLAKDVKMGPLIVLTVTIGVLAGAVALLTLFEPARLKAAVMALSVMLAVFAIFTKVIMTVANNTTIYKSAMGTLVIMTVLIGGLAVVIGLLVSFDTSGRALQAALSISILLITLVGVMGILSVMGEVGNESLATLGILILLAALAGAVIVGMTHLCSDADAAIKVAISLSLLITSLSFCCILLAAAGNLGVGGFIGIGVLAALIVALGALIIGIGALMTYVPQLEEFLNKGIPILEKIGYALGSFFGNIVGGFLDGIIGGLSGLGELADGLSDFMNKLQPFVDGVKQFDATTVDAVKSLTGMILTLTAANILDGISKFITGKSSFEQFAQQIVPFGDAIVAFSNKVKGNVDADSVLAAANAGEMLAKMCETLPKTDGVVQWFAGQSDLGAFSNQINMFGTAIVGFSNKVKGNIDANAVTAAANAGKTLVELQNTLPQTGGVVEWFAGKEGDLATFGNQIVVFGDGMVRFSQAITGEGGFNAEAVTAAANAGSALATLASNLPTSKSLFWGIWKEESSIESFANNLPILGSGLASFATKVKDIKVDAVEAAANAASAITKFCNIPVGDLSAATLELSRLCTVAAIVNTVKFDSLSSFGKSLEKLAKDGIDKFVKAFKNASDKVRKAVKDMVDSSLDELDDVDEDFKEDGKNAAIGFANGMIARKAKVAGVAAGIAEAARAAIKKVLGIASPSKVTHSFGEFTGEGFVNGLITYQSAAANAGEDLAKSAANGLTEAIAQIQDVVDADMDIQPTIRPVLDLSDVQAGAGRLSGLLDTNPSVGVEANLSAIKRLSQNNQNGVNDDVVSAIEALGEKFSGMSGNTYTINGITYDDGSNVQAAIETLVRAATIERRI